MRISDKITIRRGQAYEIKGISDSGAMLLRPTVHVELKLEDRKAVKVAPVVRAQSHTIVATHRPNNCSSHSSCTDHGSRKRAQIEHYYDCKMYEYDFSRGHVNWKRGRTKQYRVSDKRQESDPNPVHLDI